MKEIPCAFIFRLHGKLLPYAIEKVGFGCANALVYVHMDQCLIQFWFFLFLCRILIWGKMPSTEIIIILFHEDNECQSNIWSSNTKTYMRLIITDRTEIIYSMYRAGEVSVHEHAARGLPNLIPLEGGERIIQDQDQQMLPHVVREW